MARSLGLAAYRALARRGEAQLDAPIAPRPAGQLVWIHAGETRNLLAVQDLAMRIVTARRGVSVLITTPDDYAATPPTILRPQGDVFQIKAPSEHPAAIAAFLDHWAPNVGIWVWGGLKPNLIFDAAQRNCPLFLIDADVDGIELRQSRWLPDLTRRVLAAFDTVIARSEAGHKRLIQLGLNDTKVQQTTALLAGGQVLGCVDSDLNDLAAAMSGRPAWFATQVLSKEIPIVLAAHKQALRLSHRLMLILQPATSALADTAVDLAAEQNMTLTRWDDGHFPDETTQVLITGEPADRGLFFRVAPVSFLGTTLVQGKGGCDPLDAASLGSAILYGPKVRHYLPSYSRLAAAGAARIVNDADALGTAVSTLIAPDHAAKMAFAGWDVISKGAALTDKVIDLVQDTLDIEMSRT
jgi:3-deoxy-D-manno-octulosonic-acid transferase